MGSLQVMTKVSHQLLAAIADIINNYLIQSVPVDSNNAYGTSNLIGPGDHGKFTNSLFCLPYDYLICF